MQQDHVFSPGEQVLSRGGIPQAGYTLRGDAVYDRARIFAAPWRLKEWDFYQIADDKLCLQLVIGHVSYVGNCNIALFDPFFIRSLAKSCASVRAAPVP